MIINRYRYRYLLHFFSYNRHRLSFALNNRHRYQWKFNNRSISSALHLKGCWSETSQIFFEQCWVWHGLYDSLKHSLNKIKFCRSEFIYDKVVFGPFPSQFCWWKETCQIYQLIFKFNWMTTCHSIRSTKD